MSFSSRFASIGPVKQPTLHTRVVTVFRETASPHIIASASAVFTETLTARHLEFNSVFIYSTLDNENTEDVTRE